MYINGNKINSIYDMAPNRYDRGYYFLNKGTYYTVDYVNNKQIKINENDLYLGDRLYTLKCGEKTYIHDVTWGNIYSSFDNINFTLEQWDYKPNVSLSYFSNDLPCSLPFVHNNKILYVSNSTPNKKKDLVIAENGVFTVYENALISNDEKVFFYSDILQSYVICANASTFSSNRYSIFLLTKDFSEYTDLKTYLNSLNMKIGSLLSNYIYEYNGYFIVMYESASEAGIIYTRDGVNWTKKVLGELNNPDTKIFYTNLSHVTNYKVINNKLYIVVVYGKIFVFALDENLNISNIPVPVSSFSTDDRIGFIDNNIYLIIPRTPLNSDIGVKYYTYTTYKYDGEWKLVDELCFKSYNKRYNFEIRNNIIYFI